jgi:hypothetical protein
MQGWIGHLRLISFFLKKNFERKISKKVDTSKSNVLREERLIDGKNNF